MNDARETPATPIIMKLTDLGAIITVYDPLVVRFPIAVEKDLQKAVIGADAIVIVTDHSELKSLDLKVIRALMKENPILVDGRNIVTSAEGFIFRSIGR